MSYDVPTKKYAVAADVDALATFLAQRQSDSATTNGGIVATGSPAVSQMGVDAAGLSLAYLKGMADALLCGMGCIGQSDAAGLGSASTTSTSFVDIGNGSSTGYPPWTITAPITKSYLLRICARAYASVSPGGNAYMQALLDGSAIAGQPTSTARQFFGTTGVYWPFVWEVIVPLIAGSHTFKLQWKVDSGVTANVDINGGRLFTLVGC